MYEKFISSKLDNKSVGSIESTDSLSKLDLEEQANKKKDRLTMYQYHDKVEGQERHSADSDLEVKLSVLSALELTLKGFSNDKEALAIGKEFIERNRLMGITPSAEELKAHVIERLVEKKKLSTADQIKDYKIELSQQGKSPSEILQLLISKFENEEAVSTWIENWKKFLKLHHYAENKTPAERKAIENIINNANFTTENSFDLAMSEVQKSTEISEDTKLDIQRKFKTTGIKTVRAFDRTLKNEKQYKKSIEKKIQSRNTDIENLQDEINNLNTKLDKLPPRDPKRSELETKLKEKGNLLKVYEQEISALNETKPDNVQFQLRNDLLASLNPNGSRSIKITSKNFTIQLPSNKLPLMGTKNLHSINVAFPFLALCTLHISNEIFAPDLVNNGVPTKAQRDTSHLILSSLGIDDSQILSEKDNTQLKNDLSHLTDSNSGKTGRECLIELGIYDDASQNVDKHQLKKILQFIKANRNKAVSYSKLARIL